ncbi:MFS transporter [Boudabousia marimammalium]|uniref:MFS transporter n=1 Tax=Boudabousia marimammalium TaxID=156892 RepID=UPI000AE95ADE|nr:MFS transporter [Boudabousia marimammalium]
MSTKSQSKEWVTLPKSTQAPIVYLVVLLAFMGQMLLSPIIAPLSRELGMQEWHIGVAISLAAFMVVVASPLWGKTSQKRGVKPVLTAAMLVALLALIAVAAISFLGLRGIWVGPSMIIGFMLTRGLIYGGAIAAVTPAAQTHFVTQTETEAQRVKAVGGLGAVNGLASILGAVLGGGLAAIGGLMLPLIVTPLLMLAGLIVLVVFFKPAAQERQVEEPKSVSYFDPRAFPFLISGLMLFVGFASVATIFGFLVQDRFALSASGTAGVAAVYMALMSFALILAQAVIASQLGWNSVQLMRLGFVVTVVGLLLIMPGGSYVLLGLGAITFGMGAGLAMLGYSAGPTMEMSQSEQGSLAGLINSNNGAAYVIAPVASTALYGVSPYLSLGIGVVILGLVTVFVFVHPKFRALSARKV